MSHEHVLETAQPYPPTGGASFTNQFVDAERDGLIHRIWRRRAMVLGLVLLGVVGALIYLAAARRVYVSTSVLSVTDSVGGGAGDAIYPEAHAISSWEVLGRAVRSPTVKSVGFLSASEDPARMLADALHVGIHPGNGLLSVSVESSDPATAALLANAVVQAYLDQRAAVARAQQPTSSVPPTPRETPANDAAVRQAALDEFLKANPEFISPESADAIGNRLAKLTEALTAAQIQAADAKADYDAARPLFDQPDKAGDMVSAFRPKGIYGPLDQQTDQLEAEIGAMQKQLELDSRKLGAQNPALVALHTRIEVLQTREKEIDAKKLGILQVYLEQHNASSAAKVSELLSLVDEQKKAVAEHVTKAARFAALSASVKDSRDAAAAPQSDSAAAPAPDAVSALQVHVLEAASPASSPAWPRPTPVIARGMVCGLVAGLLLAAIWIQPRAPHRDPQRVTVTTRSPQ